MKATQVGNTVYQGLGERKLDRFSLFGAKFHTYISEKYEGLFPDNMPTRDEMKELNELRRLDGEIGDAAERQWKKKNKIINGVAKEWMRQQ